LPRGRRRLLLAVAAFVALLLASVIFAAHDAKRRILQAWGPRTTVGSISLNYPTVTLHDVRVAASDTPGAWPSGEEFSARTVAVDIGAASLWAYRRGEPLAIADVRVSDGTLAMLRTPGHLTVLPALRDTSRARAARMNASGPPTDDTPVTSLILQHMRFDRMAVDLYDTTLEGGRTQHLHFDGLHGTMSGLALPALAQPIALDLAGTLKGVERDGQVSINGSLTPAAHDASLAIRLAGVDMVALQAYLLRLGERSVRHGTLDLSLDARIADRQVHAPGQLAITGLEFGDGDGATFAGVGRRAVLAALRRDGRIALKFTLEGRTDDPKFSLDENLALRLAGGLGGALGGGLKSVAGTLKSLLENKPAR
jgi:hypothetical protein